MLLVPSRLVAVLAATLASVAAAPASAEDVLALGVSEPVPAADLVEALRLRVNGSVEVRSGAQAGDGVWVLEATGDDIAATVTLRAPDGRTWERPVEFEPGARRAERARAVALQAGYIASLAGAPFAVDTLPPGPEPLPSTPPPASGTESPSTTVFHLDLAIGASGDLWGTAAGESRGLAIAFRPGFAWSWGLWLEIEAGWERLVADREADVSLNVAPFALGLGVLLPWESWSLRASLRAVVQYWRASGEALHASDWRSGGGLLVAGAYRVASWCDVGLEAGLDFLPRAVQLDYAGQPLLALGQFRWRAGVWIGFAVADL
jgi:hypothetical protein